MRLAPGPLAFHHVKAFHTLFPLVAALGLSSAVAAGAPNAPLPPSGLRYDVDYPVIGYFQTPVDNEIARLQARLDRGEVVLEFSAPRGYLDSLLKALRIDPSSQVLVYSKTSLQFRQIRAATPRAIYFNDDTYVAWVQGSDLLEVATMDSTRGAVFYTLPNHRVASPRAQRETFTCLSCHDTFSLTGGGVPRFLLLSGMVNADGALLPRQISTETDDRTPLSERWGGWYVTGQHEGQVHRGNMMPRSPAELLDMERARRGNLATLDALFDTRPYLSNRSDIVALLVLEHQLYIKNLITRLNFKTRSFLAREAQQRSLAQIRWQDTSPVTRRSLQQMMDQLVEAMLFAHAAPLTGRIQGGAGFERSFERLGPRDASGRSLRDFDLQRRLFRYPLSYVIYSEGFDALPQPTRAYLYRRLAVILTDLDRSATFAHLSATDRQAILQILTATKADFARSL